jgi:hypothetical protein
VYLPENIEISPGSVLTHNHPTLVSSLSDADVITSLSHDVRQIRATAGEYVWTLDLPVFTSPAERDQVIEEVKEAFRFARAEMDGVIFPQINSGMMSVADANHIASGGLLDKFFMDIYGTEHGFVLTREHVGNSDGLSEADVAIVQRVRKDATTGFQFMNRLAVYEDDDTRFDSGTHRNNGIHFTAFRIAIKDGAEGVLRVGPTLTTKLTFKRKLTDGDFAEIKRKYDMLLSAYSENAKESVSSSAYTNMAAFNIPSKVWRDVAKAYPDLLDFHVDYTPGRDPLDMIDRLLMNEDNPNRPKWVTLKAWDESQVNRHPAGTPVDSGTGAGGGRFAPKENAGDADKEPARVWQDKRQAAAESVPTKLDVGALGERMVAAIFEHLMETPFRTLNDGRSNAPLDLFGDHMAVEVKAGLASNQDGAQKWRSTIGEPGKAEKALLAQMGAEEKREHNAWKRAEILRRKQAFAEQLSKRTPDGQPVDPVTIGLIFAPDLRTVDLYVIDGYHLEMRWSQYATEKNLLATYRVDEWLN